METKKKTKKLFLSKCSFHVYTGRGEKHNVIYYMWINRKNSRGFLFAFAASTEDCTKKQLIDYMYNSIINDDQNFPYYVRYKFAFKSEGKIEPFKIPLALNF